MLEERLVAVRRALGSGKDGLVLEHVPSGARDGARRVKRLHRGEAHQALETRLHS